MLLQNRKSLTEVCKQGRGYTLSQHPQILNLSPKMNNPFLGGCTFLSGLLTCSAKKNWQKLTFSDPIIQKSLRNDVTATNATLKRSRIWRKFQLIALRI